MKNVYIASAYPDQNFANRDPGDVLFIGSFTGADDIYRSLNYMAAVDFLQLGFTAAGSGNYFVQSKTRDE